MAEPLTALGEYIDGMVKFARASERIGATLRQMQGLHESLHSLYDLDPELAPEIRTAMDQLEALHETLKRAFAFIDARHDVQLDATQRAFEHLPPQPNHEEGGSQ